MFLKILIVILAIGAVVVAFRAWGRKEGALSRRQEPPPPAPGRGEGAAETLRCRVCDAFVPIGTKAACARPDCPFR